MSDQPQLTITATRGLCGINHVEVYAIGPQSSIVIAGHWRQFTNSVRWHRGNINHPKNRSPLMGKQTPSEESIKKAEVALHRWKSSIEMSRMVEAVALALDAARAEERERCAKFVQRIADAQMEESLKDVGTPWMKDICVLAAKRLDAMAAAIRRLPAVTP